MPFLSLCRSLGFALVVLPLSGHSARGFLARLPASAPPGPEAQATAAPGPERKAGYIGSKVCSFCHLDIYDAWKKTRHNRSILSSTEARRAGYPLAQPRRGRKALTIHGWEDVSYVIAGKQRITYADATGLVQGTSYHHRTGEWRPFPEKPMDCAPCHVTGPGVESLKPFRPEVPGRFAELNVGCEACHGPGKRHVETYDKKDIVVDVSSRLCGQCHTAAGRVLPQDDLHRGHDVVQVWNRDPHVTGVRFNSHNAFCSRCHSPYEGALLESREASRQRVFTEAKHNVTCIACHNPHATTRAVYSRRKVYLEPPVPPKLQTYRGKDRDFTTADYREHEKTEEVCLQCHRGADRIDLDHAEATCNDCHNGFKRNRSRESRPFHDANHPRLSCRPCHENADHLMAILYRDRDFLQPKHIHNLRRLPNAVIEKYGFLYPRLRRAVMAAEIAMTGSLPASLAAGGRAERKGEATGEPKAPPPRRLRELLAREPHRRLGAEEEVRKQQRVLLASPDMIAAYFELAVAYARRGATEEAREIVDEARQLTSPRILLETPLEGDRSAESESVETATQARRLAATLLPPSRKPGGEAARLWLAGYLLMRERLFAEAAQAFETARAREPQSAASNSFYLALSQIGRERFDEAKEVLESILESHPRQRASRVALGVLHLKRRRFADGRKELERAIAADPADPVAPYLLGRAYLERREAQQAVTALRAAVAANPDFLEARMLLARAFRLGGAPAAAIDAYRAVIQRSPGWFDPHYDLAELYKWLSDRLAFEHRSRKDTAPPPGTSASEWEDVLAALERQSAQYAELALSELALALSVRPDHPEAIRQVGEIYRRSGRLEEAREIFEWLARRLPGEWLPRYRLGTILVQLGRHHEAIQVLKRAVGLAPPEGDVYLALGLAYARAGRLQEAMRTFETARIYEAFNPALYNNLAAAYASAGRYDLARKVLRRALELGTFPLPRLHLAYRNLALIEMREGRRQEAIYALKNALHTFPGDAEARWLLDALTSRTDSAALEVDLPPFVFNDLLEIFGEVTTVALENE